MENNNGNYDERKHELENNRIIIQLEPNSSKKIIKIIQQTFSSNFIYETQFASCPLADLEIEINYPLGYKFELSVESFSIKPTKEIDIDGKQVYHFNAAILRGQGVEFYCEKIEC